MTDWRSIDDPEQAIGALFTEVLETAWPSDWTEGVAVRSGRPPEPVRSEPVRPPVIRLSPDRHASIDGRPDLTVIPTVPAAPREVVQPGRWSRHRVSVAQVAAAVVLLAGLGWTGRSVLDRVDGGSSVDVEAGGDLIAAGDDTTSAALVATASTPPSGAASVGPEPAPSSSTAPSPAVDTTETSTPSTVATTQATTAPTTAAPPTTVATTQATKPPTTAAPPTKPPTTAAPPTKPPTTAAPPTSAPSTTAPTTTAPPTTVPSTEPVPTTIEPPTTTEPSPADVRIRNLSVSDVTATSAVVSFTTADCAAVAYDVSRGAERGARGVPGTDQCWTQHSILIGAAEPLRPDTRYTVTVATFGWDGSSDKASIRFRTLEEQRAEGHDAGEDDDDEEDDD